MTPDQLRDKLTTLLKNTAERVDIPGWKPFSDVIAAECGEGRISFDYEYRAPKQPATRDRAGDAKVVADYWESQGLTTKTTGKPDAVVVFAGSEDIAAAEFGTGPAIYNLGARTRCIEGDIDAYPE